MLKRFTVQDVIRAKRGAGNAVIIAIDGFRDRPYRIPIDLLDFIAIDEARRGSVTPFAPHDQLARLIRASLDRLVSITIHARYAEGCLALATLLRPGKTGCIPFRAGTAISLALQLNVDMFIEPSIIEMLNAEAYCGAPFKRMRPVGLLPS